MIVVAKFGKTFGLKGEIIIQSFFENKFDIFNYKNFFLENQSQIFLSIKKSNKNILGQIEKIETVGEVKKYVGKLIYIEKNRLPKLKKGQFYYNDLENIKVLLNKTKFGYVKKINNHGAGDYLEIKTNNNEILVPFNNHHVLKVDLKNKILHLNPIYYEF